MKITLEMVEAWKHCYDDHKIANLVAAFGSEIEAGDIDCLPIPDQDKVWLLLHEEVLGFEAYWMARADIAAHVLPIWEAAYPNDGRPRKAIDTARAYARGEVSQKELRSACTAANDAAYAVVRAAYTACAVADAAAYAVAYAAYTAAYAVAYATARAAHADVELRWQVEHLLALIISAGNGEGKE